MNVQHQQSGKNGSFFLSEGEQRIAESQYIFTTDQVMNIYHTQVDEEYQGQHLGDQLISTAVEYARQHKYTIVPSCSFAQAMFSRHKDYEDVLAKS